MDFVDTPKKKSKKKKNKKHKDASDSETSLQSKKEKRRMEKKKELADTIKNKMQNKKYEKWSNDLMTLLEEKKKEKLESDKKITEEIKISPITKIPDCVVQDTIAIINYPYQRKTVEVNIGDVKSFLYSYLPKKGTTSEIKKIKKEYAQLSSAIKSCRNNNAGFIKYRSDTYYYGKDAMFIEIKRGRVKTSRSLSRKTL